MPAMFTGTWEPEADTGDALVPGQELSGIAAAPGVATGRVRILTAGELLEPGEVLVARVTDTGWTPFFGFAAAVVTDIGGLMSHPAVVAREFGIPSVVGTRDATLKLRDGQLVEVDGNTGVVARARGLINGRGNRAQPADPPARISFRSRSPAALPLST